MHSLFRSALLSALLLLTAAGAAAQALVGPSLQTELAGLGLGETTTVIVTFDRMGPLSAADRAALGATGVTQGLWFEALPIAAVQATAPQAAALAAIPGVASLWANEPLEYFNDTGTEITGVDRLRTDANLRTDQGLPYSGQGATVVVNDSGIDATHADLQYGTHVVENVQGLLNPAAYSGLLPATYVEGTPNTDTNSGHGTHCAGSVGATGARSGGLYEGVAPGADLVGYGSGGGLLILDGIGGFDYAVSRRDAFANPIRVITNSWGSSGDFVPDHPINHASYAAYAAGITVLFAAGNAGSGEDTHNPYAIAPWTISVGAGDKRGALAGFSSRGVAGEETSFTMPDGTQWTASNEITVTAPGVDIVSTRSASNGTSNGGEADAEVIAPAHLPFYTMISGTSMATPHVAGIVALMLEAKPSATPAEIKAVLKRTATNMPGRQSWEAGAGYVNAYAAVMDLRRDAARPFGSGVFALGDTYARALVEDGGTTPFEVFFNPAGGTDEVAFEVAADIDRVVARAEVTDNTVALVLTAPDGSRYGSGISLPVLGETIAATAPGQPGTWTVTVRGIGSISGVPTDPLGVTQGTAAPGTIAGEIRLQRLVGFEGLDDVGGSEYAADVRYAVANRLVDGYRNGTFNPSARMTRLSMAQYLTMGAGVRQFAPSDGSVTFADVPRAFIPYAEAVSATGGALLDAPQVQAPIMRPSATGGFAPNGAVTRLDVAYSFVQALGLEDRVAGYAGPLFASVDGERVPVRDERFVPAELRGYVQAAIDLGVLDVIPVQVTGPNATRTIYTVQAQRGVRRGEYARLAGQMYDSYFNAFEYGGPASGKTLAGTPVPAAEARAAEIGLELTGANPVRTRTALRFTLADAATATLSVYDVTGREVARLADGAFGEGAHTATLDASALASGVYVARLVSGDAVSTTRLTVVR